MYSLIKLTVQFADNKIIVLNGECVAFMFEECRRNVKYIYITTYKECNVTDTDNQNRE